MKQRFFIAIAVAVTIFGAAAAAIGRTAAGYLR
jgi:hypothetical protein